MVEAATGEGFPSLPIPCPPYTHIAPPPQCDSQLLAQPFHCGPAILLLPPAKRRVSLDGFTWVLIPQQSPLA